MKKFLALLCTMAMVLSMFTGVALAASTFQLETTLDSTTIIAYSGLSADDMADKYYVLTGTVTGGATTPSGIVQYQLVGDDASTVDVEAAAVIASSFSANGKIRLEIPATKVAVNTDYTLQVSPTTVGAGKNNDKYTAADDVTVKVRYGVTLDQDLSAVKYLDDNLLVISGRLTNADGKGVADEDLSLVFNNEVADIPVDGTAYATTNSQGAFAFAIGQIKVAKLEIKDGVAIQKSVTVNTGAFTLSKLTTSGTATISKTNITGTLKSPEGSNFTNDAGVKDLANVKAFITGVKINKAVADADKIVIASDDNSSDANYYTKVWVKWGSAVQFEENGTASVKVSWNSKLVGNYTIAVGNPATVNVLGLVEKTVGNNKDVTATVQLTGQVDKDSKPINFPAAVDVKVTAPGISYDVENADTDSSDVTYDKASGELKFDLDVTQTGDYTVWVKAKDVNGKVYGEATATAKITGFSVAADVKELAAKTTGTFSITLTDKDGNPVNNADVQLKNEDGIVWEVDSADTNIVSGTYKFEDVKHDTVEKLDLEVYQAGLLKVDLPGFFNVKGQEVYTVELNKTSVLAGVKSTVLATVKDANGTVIPAAYVDAYIDYDTTDEAPAIDTVDTWNSDHQYSLELQPTETITIVAKNADGTKYGTATVTAVKPALEISKTNITDGVKSTLTVKVTNPITGEALKSKLEVTKKEGLDSLSILDTDNVALDLTSSVYASEYTFKVLADATDAEDLDGAVPSIYVAVTPENGIKVTKAATLLVKPGTLTADKGQLFIGTNNDVTLTLKDADGVGLSGKTIKMGGTEVGKTDANGVLAYTVFPAASGNVTFTYTDLKDVKVDIPTVRDTVIPVVTVNAAPSTVKTDTVVLTGSVSDNVSVGRIFVNNREVFGYPNANGGLDFEVEVGLKLGANVVRIVATDANNNRGTADVTVTRVLPTVVKLAIGSADATINGQPATGVAPYLKGNSTMVPFRFIAEALGATVDYNNGVVTMTLEGKTVVLTIGSAVAMVDGTAVNMPVAAEIVNDRTMIPLRFVSENLGATVDWNAATSGITITR